jgi:guanylate kinase
VTPFLLILSSPSGGGKTTIARALLAAREDLGYSVSATTRAPREGERDGVDYFFQSRAEFEARRSRGEFLEWAEYGGSLYGTLTAEVDRLLESGRSVVLDIEVQGAQQVRERRSDVVGIFILPPSADVLVELLSQRGAATGEELRRRMRRAREELELAPTYDYIVENDNRTQAVSEVAAIIDSESRRAGRITALEQSVSEMRQRLLEIVNRIVPEEEK